MVRLNNSINMNNQKNINELYLDIRLMIFNTSLKKIIRKYFKKQS